MPVALVAAGSASILPASVSERTAVFEAARPGPIPGRGIVGRHDIASSECDGFAHDPAKVGDQVQFLARASFASRFPFSIDRPMTLEPDGQATGCNPVQVGSTPTGVSADRRNPLSFPPRPGTRMPIDPTHAPSKSRILPPRPRHARILSGSARHPRDFNATPELCYNRSLRSEFASLREAVLLGMIAISTIDGRSRGHAWEAIRP